MGNSFDIAALDAHLEALLDLPMIQRAARLEQVAQTEPELATVLRRLLAIAAEADTAEIRNVGQSLRLVAEDAPVPEVAGYRVTEELGRGGMAAVYAAVRSVHGIEQPVAIKVLRAALLSPLDRERFLNEQRILARLQHPNIATLIEVGTVDERPYMVMERIDGEPIDARLKPTAADLPAILDAIAQAADAVQLAHAHFVIHRDIKPDNVLLDRQGRVKLIDFGIAKILDEAGGLRADPTLSSASPLTLRYASPEQLLGRPIGVGSDIYQLGLLLYRLATGAWPYDDLDNALQAERTRPESVPVPASRRVSDPALRRALQGDLDSILLKCLRFEPAERYRSVADLREDLERHREHRPVAARRQTRGYLLRSFVLRHKLGVAIGSAALLLVAVATVAALGLAERSRQYAARTERTLDAVTEMFRPANPYAPSPKTTTVADAVERATARFLEEESGDPAFQAGMLLRLADMQEAAENFSRMHELLARAHALLDTGDGDAGLLSRVVVRELEALFRLGKYDELARLRAANDGDLVGRDRLQADHLAASVLTEQGHLPEALAALESLSAAMQPLDRVAQAQVLNSLAIVHSRGKRYEQEFATYQRAMAVLDPGQLTHLPMLVRVRANSATALSNLKRPDEGAEQYLALLPEVRTQLGPAHPMVAKVTANTVVALQGAERFADAYRVTLDLDATSALKDEPAWRAQFLTILAGAALYDGRYDRVLPNLVEAAEIATGTLGKGSPRLAYYAEQLAWTLWEFGEREVALAAAAQAHRLSEGSRTVADLLLQVGSETGSTVAGRPDPDFAARMKSDCDRVHYQVLRDRLLDAKATPDLPVPADCASFERARLETLGLRVEPPRRHVPQPMRSPLVLRWTQPQDPALAVVDAGIGEKMRERIRAVIAGF